jgi:hypothetical protein
LFFLDNYTFTEKGQQLSQPWIDVPGEYSAHVNANAQYDADIYFTSIHNIFPIGKSTSIIKHLPRDGICEHIDSSTPSGAFSLPEAAQIGARG